MITVSKGRFPPVLAQRRKNDLEARPDTVSYTHLNEDFSFFLFSFLTGILFIFISGCIVFAGFSFLGAVLVFCADAFACCAFLKDVYKRQTMISA